MYTDLLKNYINHTDEKEQVKKTLLENFPMTEYQNLLEVGCGTGVLTQALLPYFKQVISIDLEKRILPQVEADLKVKFYREDFLKFEAKLKFDCILLAYVLWEIHPTDWTRAFEKIKRYLKEKGFFIVIDVAQPYEFDNWLFDFNTEIPKPVFVTDFPMYLTENNWQFEKVDFSSKVTADTVEEMYDVLKFFFQGEKREKFYVENKKRIFFDLQNKIIDGKITISMPQELFIVRKK